MAKVPTITRLLVGLALLLSLHEATASESNDLDDLATWMTGAFSTAVQASDDPELLAINLYVQPIWTDREDGPWLYVEQSLVEYPDRPYRQRVYHLGEPASGLFEIRIYNLPNPVAVVGAWRDEAPLAEIALDDLEGRNGCEILLRRRDVGFTGSTLGSLCSSTLRGAAFATSEVLITPDGMISRDRGFTEDGRQVWGPTGEGYVFDRIVDEPEPDTEADPNLDPDQ